MTSKIAGISRNTLKHPSVPMNHGCLKQIAFTFDSKMFPINSFGVCREWIVRLNQTQSCLSFSSEKAGSLGYPIKTYIGCSFREFLHALEKMENTVTHSDLSSPNNFPSIVQNLIMLGACDL